MLWVIIVAIIIGIAVAALLRPRQPVPNKPTAVQANNDTGNRLGNMRDILPGMMLGYLVNNFLIDSYQYKAWRGLELNQLRDELSAAGIMDNAEFDSFSQQLVAGAEMHEAQGEHGYQDMI